MSEIICENCEKEMKEEEELFETNFQFVCMSCMERFNEKYELLYEVKNE